MGFSKADEGLLRDTLQAILRGLLESPEEVRVETRVSPRSGTLVFRVIFPPPQRGVPAEYRRIVGREGQTIDAVRRIMTATAGRLGGLVEVTAVSDSPSDYFHES